MDKQIHQKTKPDEYQKKKKNEIKNGKVSLPLITCSACARVWSNCMQHSCSTSVHTFIQYGHVMRACIHIHPPKAPSPKKNLGTHACAYKHTCTQLRLFPLKIIEKKITWYICTQTPKKEEEEEEEEEEKQLIPTKKYVAGIHVQAHIRARTLAHNITNTQII